MKFDADSPETQSFLHFEALRRKDDIVKLKDSLVKRALLEDPEVNPRQLRAELDQRPDVQYLTMLDSEKDQIVEGEIQKRLTKAVPFLRGKLT